MAEYNTKNTNFLQKKSYDLLTSIWLLYQRRLQKYFQKSRPHVLPVNVKLINKCKVRGLLTQI